MKPLFTEFEFNSAKAKDKLPCECYCCGKTFFKQKKYITQYFKNKDKNKIQFCNKTCSKITKQQVSCKNCNKTFEKLPNQIKRFENHFCCKSCATTFNNKNKTTGNRRSKLETYLESKLTEIYPNLEFHFNRKDAINSELDIYIPSLKLAFELNGIFHYEPIYGSNKLSQIQNNDNRKFQACIEAGISLCIIDTSSQTYFKEQSSKKFLDIICQIINK